MTEYISQLPSATPVQRTNEMIELCHQRMESIKQHLENLRQHQEAQPWNYAISGDVGRVFDLLLEI